MFSNSDERTKEMDVVKTNLGGIDLDRLRDSACFAIGVGPWERASLSPMGELRLAGCLAFASSESHGSDLRLAVNAGLHTCDAAALRKAVCRAANHEAPTYPHRHIRNLPACPWTKRFIERAERLRR